MRVKVNANQLSVDEAVLHKLYPDAYTYEGELEKLKRHIELQSELIAKLINVLCDNGNVKAKQLEEMLGFSYDVWLD